MHITLYEIQSLSWRKRERDNAVSFSSYLGAEICKLVISDWSLSG